MTHAQRASRIPPPMEPGAAEVRRLVRGKRSRLLMLDYDGTLAPFQEKRNEAFPYPGVREALQSLLGQSSTRVVIISGRALCGLIPLLRLDPVPEIWGSHGWERLLGDGTYQVGPFPEAAMRGLANADDWASLRRLDPRCEKKPGSLALHWRGLDRLTAREMRRSALRGWKAIAAEHGLEIRDFDGGIELRIPGRTKGDAVQTLLSESPPETAAAYLGDDRTDEDAFGVLGQRGLSVLVRPEVRESFADVWIRPPGELMTFLEVWASASGCV